MNVYWKCEHCSTENVKRTFAQTRVEFAMKEGEELALNCKACNRENVIAVDDFFAQKSDLAIKLAGFTALIGLPLILYFIYYLASEKSTYIVGGFILVPTSIYGIVLKQDQQRVASFNRHKFKR